MSWLASPKMALFADEEGLAIYRQIIEEADRYLTPSGKLYFEIGYKQGNGFEESSCLYIFQISECVSLRTNLDKIEWS